MSARKKREAEARARAAGQSLQGALPPSDPESAGSPSDADDLEPAGPEESTEVENPVQPEPPETSKAEEAAGPETADAPEQLARVVGEPSPPAASSGVANDPDKVAQQPWLVGHQEPAAPAVQTPGSELYDDLMAAVLDAEPRLYPVPPFRALAPKDQSIWESFAERVAKRFGAAVSAPRADGLFRCRARETVALLAATDEQGNPLRRVHGGATCLVRPDVYERAKKHLERL
jgi:hypothetical protein